MPTLSPIAPDLLAWFSKNARTLPFRQDPTPYHIWVSEIMLQQTRVAAALEYYDRWMKALPTIRDLAECDEEKLHKLWEGLGYYSRVRNLQKAARIVCAEYGGQLPADHKKLLALPGIGDYTAGAIGSIAFHLPVPAVDGNVLRVFSRLYNDDRDIADPKTKKAYTQWVMEHQPPDAPGPYNEALMELGALVCLPNGEPLCDLCPLAHLCRARQAGTQNTLPVKKAAKARRIQPVTVLLVKSEAGWLLQRRPDSGLLAGLWQPALFEESLPWAEAAARLEALGIPVRQGSALKPAKHIFSHIEWRMNGWQAEADACPLPPGYVWADRAALTQQYTLPGAFKAYRPLLEETV